MNGVARPEDIPGFSADIYREAQRLISLVHDLMQLSRLDEGDPRPTLEPVDLLRLSRDVANRLRAAVDRRSIWFTAFGEPAQVIGIPSVLDEMIFNLADNAIKYNRDGGNVSIVVEASAAEAVVTITDTGIGIPKAEQ